MAIMFDLVFLYFSFFSSLNTDKFSNFARIFYLQGFIPLIIISDEEINAAKRYYFQKATTEVKTFLRGRSFLMGNRRPECILWGPKKSCLKNVGCQIFSDFFVGSQILTLIFCKIQFFYCKMLYHAAIYKIWFL